MKSGVILVLCMVLLNLAHADWEGTPEWSFQVTLGSDITFECNDTHVQAEAGDVVQWEKAHGDVINMDSDKFTLMAHNNVQRMKLKVMDVQMEDGGVYICTIMRNNQHYKKVNRAVNLSGPLYENPVEQYRINIMIGGIAAAAFFVPLVAMCLIYKYRYMTDEERRFEKEASDRRKLTHMQDVEAGPLPAKQEPRNGGQFNPGYESTNL